MFLKREIYIEVSWFNNTVGLCYGHQFELVFFLSVNMADVFKCFTHEPQSPLLWSSQKWELDLQRIQNIL